MATVAAYERPVALDAALELLSTPDAVALAGGTSLNATETPEPVVVVDLQALDLDQIEGLDGSALSIGATTTLERVADDPRLPAAIRAAARRELPSTLRAVATIGGRIARGSGASELLALLLVHEARVEVATRGDRSVESLDGLLHRGLAPGELITRIELATSGESSIARTARTRADRPIVAAAARRPPAGEPLLALAGVAERPLLVAAAEEIDPLGDFRGSTEYRKHLATVLAERALGALS